MSGRGKTSDVIGEGVDATDLDEVRGNVRKSPDQENLSEGELDAAGGAGLTWDVGKSRWDVSRVVNMSSIG